MRHVVASHSGSRHVGAEIGLPSVIRKNEEFLRQKLTRVVILLENLKNSSLFETLFVLSSTELSELWTRHSAALLLVARGHCATVVSGLAEDCVQDAFVKLATQSPIPDSPVAWLMTCVRTTAIDAIRSQQRRVRRETSVASANSFWFEVEQASSDEEVAQLQTALKQLDRETRDIVIGYLWNDMTFRQLADVVELSPATVHRRYEQGLAQLKQLLTTSQPAEAETAS